MTAPGGQQQSFGLRLVSVITLTSSHDCKEEEEEKPCSRLVTGYLAAGVGVVSLQPHLQHWEEHQETLTKRSRA